MERLIHSQDPRLGKGSLYAALPIPACKALHNAGQKSALNVLVALVIHSDGRSPTVFPSRKTLESYASRTGTTITEANRVLVKFGFVKITKFVKNGTEHNQYEILRACFHWSEFNKVASRYKFPRAICLGCRTLVYGDEWSKSEGLTNGKVVAVRYHDNCGGRISDLTKKEILELRTFEDSAEIPLSILGSE